jgi:ABC-type sugar transport system permease subunit
MTVRDRVSHWLLVLPALVFYVPLAILPIFFGLALSLTKWSGLGIGNLQFIGLANYGKLLNDRMFWGSVTATVKFSMLNVPLVLILGLIIAVAINTKLPLVGATRTAVLVPMAMSPIAVGILFTFLMSPSMGLVTRLFKNPLLVQNPNYAMVVIVLAQAWSALGITVFVFLSGLQAIPHEIYEAANIDGAGAFRRFAQITIPLLRETLIMITIITIIGAFKTFGLIFVLTQGGPYHATELLAYWMYKLAFLSHRMGYGSAVAIVLFSIIAVMTFVQLGTTRSGRARYY